MRLTLEIHGPPLHPVASASAPLRAAPLEQSPRRPLRPLLEIETDYLRDQSRKGLRSSDATESPKGRTELHFLLPFFLLRRLFA